MQKQAQIPKRGPRKGRGRSLVAPPSGSDAGVPVPGLFRVAPDTQTQEA